MKGSRLLAGLGAVSCVAAVVALGWRLLWSPPGATLAGGGERAGGRRISVELAAEVQRLETVERNAAETVWAKEVLADECGRVVEALWDAINGAEDKLRVLAPLDIGAVIAPQLEAEEAGPHGIRIRRGTTQGVEWGGAEWRQSLGEWSAHGWRLEQAEFRHLGYESPTADRGARSEFYCSGHLHNPVRGERLMIVGEVEVEWAPGKQPGLPPGVRRVDARRLTLLARTGEPPMRLAQSETVFPPENSNSVDPLIVYDLDGDGRSEVVLAGRNVVYRRDGGGRLVARPLCRYPPGVIYSAVVGDIDTDGRPDFLCATLEGLRWYRGGDGGVFDERPVLAWAARPVLRYPMVLTCGDVDGDGDLDVFLGQYKVPYEGGQMPTPFYDANDGHPSFLLLNDGRGGFADATEASGMGTRMRRRLYGASWVDLDADGRLDWVGVSDFAGVDVFRNLGGGRFTDLTTAWVGVPQAFGMGSAFSDFNADGRVDALILGMTSATADRLGRMRVTRSRDPNEAGMRARMTAGNRLLMAKEGEGGGFEQTELGRSVERSGWSWGCSAFDCDNDGYPDVYVANGLESRASVRDYEREYWLHDAFVGGSAESPAAYYYFQGKFGRTRGRGQSYGGYEKNRLFLNRNGRSFLEVGYLFGVGLENDSRNVVSDDWDGDGRMDLWLTAFERWPSSGQTLRFYRNELTNVGHWIGFRFTEGVGGMAPAGVQVRLEWNGRSAVRTVVSGDSYRSQHPAVAHFGLGSAQGVDRAEVRWADGAREEILSPAIDRYHEVRRGRR